MEVKKSLLAESDCRQLSNNIHQHGSSILKDSGINPFMNSSESDPRSQQKPNSRISSILSSELEEFLSGMTPKVQVASSHSGTRNRLRYLPDCLTTIFDITIIVLFSFSLFGTSLMEDG